jgi:hypothetical protein
MDRDLPRPSLAKPPHHKRTRQNNAIIKPRASKRPTIIPKIPNRLNTGHEPHPPLQSKNGESRLPNAIKKNV